MDGYIFFSDETENFLRTAGPAGGETATVSLRAAGPRELSVSLYACTEAGEQVLPMPESGRRGIFRVYSARLPETDGPVRYWFALEAGEKKAYYGRNGLRKDPAHIVPMEYRKESGVPAWARGAVWYQIFPDRFRNGDPSNDPLDRELAFAKGLSAERASWDSPVEEPDVHRYYGGDLAGILEKLDYLENLGVEVLYLNPVFVSPSNHKYDTQDYGHVDPHLGRIVRDGGEVLPKDRPVPADEPKDAITVSDRYRLRTSDPENLKASDEMLAKLIAEAHRRGIRVVLDGVFNHCGSLNRWMDCGEIYRDNSAEKGAKWDENSKYRSYFTFKGKDEYEGWWGYASLPKLRPEDSDALREELGAIGRKWVSESCRADGWRLDVAADVARTEADNHRFWQFFRRQVRAVRPDALLLAEHYGDPAAWLNGREWDTVMNYDAFMDPVSFFLTGMEKHSDMYRPELEGNGEAFFGWQAEAMARLPRPALEAALNQLDNHDHSRFLTRTNHRVGRLRDLGSEAAGTGVSPSLMRAAVILQMTWPGSPGIYYGDEAGLCGFTDPDNRRPFPWDAPDFALTDFYGNAIALRKKFACLRRGSILPLAAEQGLIAYARFLGEEAVVTVIHQGREEREISLDLTPVRGEEEREVLQLLESDENGYNVGQKKIRLTDGRLARRLGPRGAWVFRIITKKTEEESP